MTRIFFTEVQPGIIVLNTMMMAKLFANQAELQIVKEIILVLGSKILGVKRKELMPDIATTKVLAVTNLIRQSVQIHSIPLLTIANGAAGKLTLIHLQEVGARVK